MKDVAARVHDWKFDALIGQYVINVAWINLLGAYEDPKPFYMSKNGTSPALEEIRISNTIFENHWEKSDDLEELQKSAKFYRAALRVSKI